MSDNASSHSASDYDAKIAKTIPYYGLFHEETLDFVRTAVPEPGVWLDTGCGTGALANKILAVFPGVRLVLADPSQAMLGEARAKLAGNPTLGFVQAPTQDLELASDSMDVVTAIQVHHYLDEDLRRKATANCQRMLRAGGVYVTFENIRRSAGAGQGAFLEQWKRYQIAGGKSPEQAEAHIRRFGVSYFPITIEDHLDLLRQSGFATVEVLWVSRMQAGFCAMK
ncbi:MAG: class I SAM-dependent methyltransferase [Desulfovibrionaceae bacterium]